VDVVVANAGVSLGTATGERADADAFARILRVNVAAMFDTFTPFVPAMRARRGGVLAGIASVAGIRGMPGAGGYCASKAAAIAYLESLRLELAPHRRARGHDLAGFVRTPMTARNRFPMPFLIDADAFAREAVPAIERGVRYATIPRAMGAVSWALRRLPRPLYDAAFARAPRKRQGRRMKASSG
jgi:short-subunit dehydrogenase